MNLMIIEDDKETYQKYMDTINANIETNLVCITNNSMNALAELQKHDTDAVILDLELLQGVGTGLDFLTHLNDLSNINRPFIIVVTNNTSTITLEAVRKLGADFIFSKHNDNYSEEKIIELLLSIKNSIIDTHKTKCTKATALSPEISKRKKTSYLSDKLIHLGITPKLKGYNYLIKAILLYEENPSRKYTELIALSCKKSKASVERAMQNAIIHAWTCGNTDDLLEYFPAKFSSDRANPTLMEFISVFAESIKQFNT